MTEGQRKKSIFILIIVLISCAILAPTFLGKEALPEKYPFAPIKLGLDLRGGSYLVLGVETEKAVESQLRSIGSSVKAELRNKEKVRGLRYRTIGAREIEFTLLGEKHLEKMQSFIGSEYPELSQITTKTTGQRSTIRYQIGQMRFREIENSAVLQAIETIRNRVDQYGVAEPVIQRVGEKRIMVQLPDVTNMDRVKKTIGSVAQLEFRLVPAAAALDSGADTVQLKSRDGGFTVVEDEILMTGDAIKTANVEINPTTNEIAVSLRFKPSGTKLFDRITSENVNRQLAIVLDSVVQSAPVIRDRISGGTAQITGQFSPEEAHQLAIVLRSGSLPAPLTFEEERTVGASLGADSIRKGVIATIAGSILVMVFILFYYGKSGFLAVGCLVLNLVFLLALLALLGATLTLPGIAGLALTVGMAVDANVIIYERIRDEIRNGVGIRAAIQSGFEKTYWTIVDANITTLLTGIILYGFGTGPIKGFAVTLCLGIITSVFAALVVCRLGFETMELKNKKGALSI